MSLTRADVIAYLEHLTGPELDEFIAVFQKRLRLDPPVPRRHVFMGAAPTMGRPIEDPEFAVELLSAGEQKLAVIKAVRELWTIGLMEAKKLVESAPVVLRDYLSRHEAEAIAGPLRDAGAEIRIR